LIIVDNPLTVFPSIHFEMIDT